MIQATDGMSTRYHLVGHSYGARVLLAAITHPRGGPLSNLIDSLLLLQPAVNHLCFADRLPNGHPGGFRQALDLVRQPILTTYTPNDFALHKVFHLALRRGKDLGEIEIAGDEPPNEYAALGGYGPRGFADWGTVAIKDPPEPYDLGAGAPGVWAVNGSRTISGHGAVVNESTAWALCNLTGR
jgi:pimeloyl-ACP methyl ester carboxylesterase